MDTSQSMSLPASSDLSAGALSRSAIVSNLITESDFVSELEKSHQVTTYAFDDTAEPRELESRTLVNADAEQTQADASQDTTQPASRLAVTGLLCLLGMALLGLASFVLAMGGRPDAIGGPLASSSVLLLIGARAAWGYLDDGAATFVSIVDWLTSLYDSARNAFSGYR